MGGQVWSGVHHVRVSRHALARAHCPAFDHGLPHCSTHLRRREYLIEVRMSLLMGTTVIDDPEGRYLSAELDPFRQRVATLKALPFRPLLCWIPSGSSCWAVMERTTALNACWGPRHRAHKNPALGRRTALCRCDLRAVHEEITASPRPEHQAQRLFDSYLWFSLPSGEQSAYHAANS